MVIGDKETAHLRKCDKWKSLDIIKFMWLKFEKFFFFSSKLKTALSSFIPLLLNRQNASIPFDKNLKSLLVFQNSQHI